MSIKPKKGGAKGKKGKKVKKGEKGDHDLEERYKKTLHEITSLRVELGELPATRPARCDDIPADTQSWCTEQRRSRLVNTANSVSFYRCRLV